MLIDCRTLESDTLLKTDLCVLGGGAVGIAIAREFAGTGTDVIVVEGGGLDHEDDSQALYGGEQTGVPYFDLVDSRCRLFGGSTYRWGARGAPMLPVDFAVRSWMDLSGWPLTLEELRPYYRRTEELMGMNPGFQYDGRVWESFEANPPVVDERQVSYQAFQFGKNVLFGKLYRPDLERASNVRVVYHANVIRLHATEDGDHVRGVELRTLDGTCVEVEARKFVLACGGIENPRILLLSVEARSPGLCNERDQVGRYFMEHPTTGAGMVVSDDVHAVLDVFSPGLVDGRLIEIGLAVSADAQERRRCLNAVAAVKPNLGSDGTQALREILWDLTHYRPMRDGFKERVKRIVGDPLSLATNLYRHAAGKPKRFAVDSLFLELRTEQEPNPDSRVTLSDSLDELGLRRSHLHWALTDLDRFTMRATADIVGSELVRMGLGRLESGEWMKTDDGFSDDLVGGHHHMGTTRMSADPSNGVVNRECRAHGVDNLWIAGSSVFATASYVNPTPTALALALRLADHLKGLG